jgi:hypothetical protein
MMQKSTNPTRNDIQKITEGERQQVSENDEVNKRI